MSDAFMNEKQFIIKATIRLPEGNWSLFCFIALTLLLGSCSQHIGKQKSPETIIYPLPPDTARIQFLTSFSSSDNVTKKKSKFAEYLFGPDNPVPVLKPYGVSIYNGKLFICDVELKGLEIFDLGRKSFEQFIPKGQGQLKLPINCFVDNNGIIYVSDVERRQVVVFDPDKNYLNSFGDTGNFKPTDVFVFEDRVYVTDSRNNKVNVYRKGFLNLIDYFPKVQPGDSGFLYQPTNIYVTPEEIYVSDFGDFKIKIYTHDGKFISSVGSYGNSLGQFVRPKGIAVDREANLYVVDAGFENVQVFNKDGKLLMFFGGSYKGPGDLWLPTKVIVDYNNLDFFRHYVDEAYQLKYLIFVTNQYGPDKINVYGAIAPAEPKP
jgi:sugar lactone lactonase YvrE